MKQQRNIIFFLIVIFIASSLWLFIVSNNILNKNEGKNWWSVYFSNPKSNDIDFVIENHSNNSNFHWEVYADKNKIEEGDAEIKKGSASNFDPEISAQENQKITISVDLNGEKREIYKNF